MGHKDDVLLDMGLIDNSKKQHSGGTNYEHN
jgi:hypothetical protein